MAQWRGDSGWRKSVPQHHVSPPSSHTPLLCFSTSFQSLNFLPQHILQTSRVLTEAQTDLGVDPKPLHLDTTPNFFMSRFLHL